MSRPLGLGMAALTGVQVGLAMVATRALDGAVGPFTLGWMRYGIAVIVLWPFFLRLRAAPLRPGDTIPVLGLGVVQFGVLIALLNAGLERVTAAQGAVLFAVFPLFTMGLGALFGTERLGLSRVAGAVLSIVGIAICLGASEVPGDPVGVALVLAAAFSGAICAVLYKPYLLRYPTLKIGMLAMLAAVVALSPGAAVEEVTADVLRSLEAREWMLVLFVGLSSGAGYVIWLTALKHAAPSEATILMGLSPITAALLGWAFLGEPLTAGFGLGLALALAGVSLAMLRRG